MAYIENRIRIYKRLSVRNNPELRFTSEWLILVWRISLFFKVGDSCARVNDVKYLLLYSDRKRKNQTDECNLILQVSDWAWIWQSHSGSNNRKSTIFEKPIRSNIWRTGLRERGREREREIMLKSWIDRLPKLGQLRNSEGGQNPLSAIAPMKIYLGIPI